jgi:predicted alpha/beta hydrolase family esterase
MENDSTFQRLMPTSDNDPALLPADQQRAQRDWNATTHSNTSTGEA